MFKILWYDMYRVAGLINLIYISKRFCFVVQTTTAMLIISYSSYGQLVHIFLVNQIYLCRIVYARYSIRVCKHCTRLAIYCPVGFARRGFGGIL